MRPAWSVLLLTTLIGAGQGLFLALFALDAWDAARGQASLAPWFVAAAVFGSLALTGGGLVASFFHLGHPERAWRSAAMAPCTLVLAASACSTRLVNRGSLNCRHQSGRTALLPATAAASADHAAGMSIAGGSPECCGTRPAHALSVASTIGAVSRGHAGRKRRSWLVLPM